MKNLTLKLAFLICIYSQAQNNTILTDVSIVDVENGKILTKQNIVIQNETITAILPSLKNQKKEGYKMVDCKNKYVVPGYIDAHAHIPDSNNGDSYDAYFLSYLYNGVTSLRVLRYSEKNATYRDSINRNKYVGPNLFLCQPPISKFNGYDELVNQFDYYRKNGYNFVKYLCCLTKNQLDSVTAILQQKSIPIVGHVHEEGILYNVQHKFRSIEHLKPFVKALKKDSATVYSYTKYIVDNNTFICPTYFWYYYSWDQIMKKELYMFPELEFVPAKTLSAWKKEYEKYETTFILAKNDQYLQEKKDFKADLKKFDRYAKYLSEHKVKLLVGSDDQAFGVPGFSYHREIAFFKNAGISNFNILNAITTNAALCLFMDKSIGKVKETYQADLVILNGNPLENIENLKNIHYVIKSGRCYNIDEIKEKLVNAVKSENEK